MPRPIEVRNTSGVTVFSVSALGDLFVTHDGAAVLETNANGVGFNGTAPAGKQAAAAQGALTDSTSGTTDGVVSTVATAVTGVDGTASNAASKADVDARLGVINSNFAELATLANALRSALVTAGLIKGAA